MTSGSSVEVVLPPEDGVLLLVSFWGGFRRSPVVPPIRPSRLVSEMDGWGLSLSLPWPEPGEPSPMMPVSYTIPRAHEPEAKLETRLRL
ncbi:hypothetical protein PV377_44580, partial [Streptomyces ipomoeae]|uniref:hypothetical protein n=1 Tax=Streptomyces ipomoeae TaxID=103232 RepID=UPI0029BF9528